MEPRPLHWLAAVIRNVWDHLPAESWNIHFVHGPQLPPTFLEDPLLKPVKATNRLHLRRFQQVIGLIPAGHVVKANFSALNGRGWYNQLLLTPAFWASFDAPLLLLFEADTALCPSPTAQVRQDHDTLHDG